MTFEGARASLAGPSDYLALLKPRVMSLVVFTALAAMIAAPGSVHPVIGAIALWMWWQRRRAYTALEGK